MTKTTSELANFIIDLEDEECPNFGLHLAAYQGDIPQLLEFLKDPEYKENIDARIRPFLASPLRLAATAGCADSIKVLLEHGAKVDKSDVKAQTPLFVATVNQHWECAKILLEAGADPNGDEKNLCTPLAVMAQRGYYDGIKLLCRYGADTEDIYRLMTGLPGFPITITATYHHLQCFATLLVHGAKPDLTDLEYLNFPSYVTTQCSVPHAIIKYRCPPEYVFLYREFGGNLWIRDSRDRLATEISDRAPALALMKKLQETPLSLQSACRLVIRKALGVFNLDKIDQLEIPPPFDQFIAFREFFISSAGQPGLFETNLVAISKVSRALKEVTKDLPTRKRYAKCKGLALKEAALRSFTEPEIVSMSSFIEEEPPSVPIPEPQQQQVQQLNEVEGGGGGPPPPPPPPPPPQPAPPRPGFWRFPGAEFADKGRARR